MKKWPFLFNAGNVRKATMAMEYYASQDVFDYDVRQRPNTALHQIHAHVRYIFSSHVISAKNSFIKYTTRVKIEHLLS